MEQKIEGQPFFSVKYKNINEAITEYFSRKAITYLNGNVLPSKENDMKREPCSVYDSMLPLVEKLFASGYKEDFIQAKFFGDVKKLENKVGLVNMMKISKCFNKAFLKENEDIAGQKECVKEMEQILSRIGRIKR